jgi:hypothetical protein
MPPTLLEDDANASDSNALLRAELMGLWQQAYDNLFQRPETRD